MCYLASRTTQAEAGWLQYTAEFLACHSNPPDSIVESLRWHSRPSAFSVCITFCLECALRHCRAVLSGWHFCAKQMCSPVFRSMVRGRFGVCVRVVLQVFNIWIPGLVYTRPVSLICPRTITAVTYRLLCKINRVNSILAKQFIVCFIISEWFLK